MPVTQGQQDDQPQAPEKTKRNAKGQWPPGVSGNPKGPGAGRLSLTTVLRRICRERAHPENPDDETTKGDLLMEAAYAHAVNGNSAFFKELLDRLEGKVPDRIEAKLGGDWSFEYQAVDDSSPPPDDEAGDGDE